MSGIVTHLAIADKIYTLLGGDIIKNLPLFFCGNIAPDAVHAKKDYHRIDKLHSHLCEGICLYGYGSPENAKLFQDRINEFVSNYYLPSCENKDLYLGYIVHLLVDQLDSFAVCNYLEEHMRNNGFNDDKLGLYNSIIEEVNHGGYREFFSISANEYNFKANVLYELEEVWDYEVKDYIDRNELNISKRWVINNYFSSDQIQDSNKHDRAIKFIDHASTNIRARLRGIV